jgi:hypothetical protein
MVRSLIVFSIIELIGEIALPFFIEWKLDILRSLFRIIFISLSFAIVEILLMRAITVKNPEKAVREMTTSTSLANSRAQKRNDHIYAPRDSRL